ncbi:FMN reductase [Geotalea uraniireducens]|uniref:FMN reductase n=1 Tax=Geotalea uraniireducens TaxID=351604 RepID=A0ABM8EQ66_9BACT|nr:flavodoxin family protein [Geotalea uraniireducens]BDV44374.1 FMN reductase [Geotalea uraniireducens]
MLDLMAPADTKNIVCLLGSPRPNGTSATIARRFLDTAASLGAVTRTFHLNALAYRGCQGCYACKGRVERCTLRDDLTAVLEAVKEADMTVLASPVYYGDVTAQLKGFIDRTFSYLVPDFLTSSTPSRLPPGKTLVFIQTQGFPDERQYADIFPRYESFLRWSGFAECHLVRACGVGRDGATAVSEEVLARAEEAARRLLE